MALEIDNQEKVKIVLDYIRDREGNLLSKEDKDAILKLQAERIKQIEEEMKKPGAEKPNLETAVEKIAFQSGLITPEALKTAEREQANSIAVAALKDIDAIAKGGQQSSPKREGKDVPYWNPELGKDPSPEAAAQNAAHAARNMVILANKTGDKKLAEGLKGSVDAAARLAEVFSEPGLLEDIPKGEMNALKVKVMEGLRNASAAAKEGPAGQQIEEYAAQLGASIEHAHHKHQLDREVAHLKGHGVQPAHEADSHHHLPTVKNKAVAQQHEDDGSQGLPPRRPNSRSHSMV